MTSLKRRLLARSGASMTGTEIGWSKPLPVRSPALRTLPLARVRLDQAKVQLLAVRCPPAPTWRAELPQLAAREKVAPVAFMAPLTTMPNVPELTFSEANRTA